uniref:Uncharacterized protein n=1 Tax=Arundo donax TaxID=35708 RepID=A0A0A8YTQ8_ARUDO
MHLFLGLPIRINLYVEKE